MSEQSSLSHPNMATVWRDICENCDLGMAGVTTSRCLLRDTRLVIAYFAALVALGVWGVVQLFW